MEPYGEGTFIDLSDSVVGKQDVFRQEYRCCDGLVVWGSYPPTGVATHLVECQPFGEGLEWANQFSRTPDSFSDAIVSEDAIKP
jgi:hypothetical protein